MILMMIVLLSLSVIYLCRLLHKKNMRAAAVSVVALYVYLVLWIYAIFIIDIADLGFSDAETCISLLHGSNVYHSFVEVTAKMAVIPLPLLNAIVSVAGIILISAFAVVLHGLFDFSQELVRSFKKKGLYHRIKSKLSKKGSIKIFLKIPLIRLYCRANC